MGERALSEPLILDKECPCGRVYRPRFVVSGCVITPYITEVAQPMKPVLTDTFWNKEYHGEMICGKAAFISGQKSDDPGTWYEQHKDNVIEIGHGFSYLLDPYKQEFIDESGVYRGMDFGWGYPRQLAYRPQWHVFGQYSPKWGGNWQETYDGSMHWFSMTS